MRALSLLGLGAAGSEPLRLHLGSEAPLVLPCWLPAAHREALLDFHQAFSGQGLLARLEVTWDRALLEPDRRFLRAQQDRHGDRGVQVVVRVEGEGVDLDEVLREPDLFAFRHLAVVAEVPVGNENLGGLRELGSLVVRQASAIYQHLAEEHRLRAEAERQVRPLVTSLLDPVVALEVYNALIDVQVEDLPEERLRDAVVRRILRRLLDSLEADEVTALAALAVSGRVGDALARGRRGPVLRRLRARMLIRNGALVRWAAFLREQVGREVLLDRLCDLPADARRERLLRRLGVPRAPVRWEDIRQVLRWMDDGELARALAALEAMEPAIGAGNTSLRVQAAFWEAAARLRKAQGRWDLAEHPLREAVRLREAAQDASTSRGIALNELARWLRDHGRWAEAEPMFREALRLKEEGHASATSRGVTCDDIARGLRDQGRWAEAEPVFGEALRLKEQGGDTLASRGITLTEWARGLRDQGRWAEAEPLFRRALRLKEQGDATPTSRAITLENLAHGLHGAGRWAEAEPLFREAVSLLRGDGAPPSILAPTLRRFAGGLRDQGRWVEAEPLLREVLRLLEEAEAPVQARVDSARELACGLREQGREDEAVALEAEVLRLFGA
jgi:tetratricopeptide (TPR) repeat protein